MKDFADDVRHTYTNRLWKKGMPVPESTTFVSWQDGHGPALKAIINEKQQAVDADFRMVTCKHSSSATATPQACDVGSQFRTIKTLIKSTTEENLPNVAVKGLFVQELDEAKKIGILDLNLKDRKALIDHVATMGDILTGVMTKKQLRKVLL